MTRDSIKYTNDMTQEEIDEFIQKINALDAAYTDAARCDSKQQATPPDEWDDESEYWRRAGLDSKGMP